MALFATLQLGDNVSKHYTKTFQLVDCSLHFARKYNHAQPETNARCQSIDLTLIAPDKCDLSLFDWYLNKEEHDGRIVFSSVSGNVNDSGDEREILFEGAMCYRMAEDYSIQVTNRRSVKLYLAAEDVTVCGLIY